MWLAIDSAWGIGSVAVGRPGEVLALDIMPRPREHAAALVPMIEAVLKQAGGRLADLAGIVIGDGPGSFTGLRIGASVAKALVESRGIELWTAPSLMAMAWAAHTGAGHGILAFADALRGEVFAGLYRFEADRVITLYPAAARQPGTIMDTFPVPDTMIGEAPNSIVQAFEAWAGNQVLPVPEGGAAALLDLMVPSGGARRIPDAEVWAWEPDYGRPAEAQVKWEQAHGRRLADSPRADR